MSTPVIHCLAPAKLNLFLHITGRRPDGYHQLQTLFQLLDFGDDMTFTLDEPGVLSLHISEHSHYKQLPLDDNLILQAARRLQAADPGLPGLSISLTKRIPPGAGLGGGSANAAMTLLAANRLWKLGMNSAALQRIGLALGADIPVFIEGYSAWAEGVGEALQQVSLEPAWYVVLCPDCEVSTARIFSQENLTRNSSAIKMADFLAGRSRNDCESVTCALYPEVKRALSWLDQFAPARMTGTGAAVFASFTDEARARQVFEQRPADLTGFVARGRDALEFNFSGD